MPGKLDSDQGQIDGYIFSTKNWFQLLVPLVIQKIKSYISNKKQMLT